MTVQLLTGDCREVLATLPERSIQCVVTSPPYHGLRAYGGDPGMIGLEPTIDEHIAALVDVFRGVWRVLKDDGTVWLNYGDRYAGSWGNQGRTDERGTQRPINGGMIQQVHDGRYPTDTRNTGTIRDEGIKPKDLIGLPWRIAFALQADGWYLRSAIVWHKPNPMPESVQGSRVARHRVTISEYENLQRVRYTGERGDQDGTGNVPRLSAREIPGCEAPLSAEREGQSDGTSSGRASGRERETSAVFSIGARQAQQGEVRGDGQGPEHEACCESKVSGKSTRQTSGGRKTPAHEGPAKTDRADAACEREVRQVREDDREETTGLRTASPSDCAGPGGDCRGLVGDCRTAPASVSLLRQAQGVDDRSCDSDKQGRPSREGEHRASLSELQFEEERQADPSLLVDCPGCPKCHNGYIITLAAGRPTSAYEHIFLLTKSARYYYDAAAIAEPVTESTISRVSQPTWDEQAGSDRANGGAKTNGAMKAVVKQDQFGIARYTGFNERWEARDEPPLTRNARNVWTIPTAGFAEAHFAVFPPEIPRRCILAGTSDKGECPACGAPWVRVVEAVKPEPVYVTGKNVNNGNRNDKGRTMFVGGSVTTTGWQPSCTCDAGDPVPQTVLDPFAGAGTTLLVADRLGRNAVGVEVNPEYVAMAQRRITNDAPLFVDLETA